MQRVMLTLALMMVAMLSLVNTTEAGPVPDGGRSKRQSADVKTAEYLAWIALGGRIPSRGCLEVACGVVDVINSLRIRRSSSDQRIAELQALMALTGNGDMVAHGHFDPLRIGKKKRDFNMNQRYNLLRTLIERAAENNMPPNWVLRCSLVLLIQPAVMVMSRLMVRRPSQGSSLTTNTTFAHENSHHKWAAYQGPVVFTGPSGLRDYRPHRVEFPDKIGNITLPRLVTGDIAFMTRAAPGTPFPLAKHGRSGEIGWPVETFKIFKGL